MIKVYHRGYGVVQKLPSLEVIRENVPRYGVLYLLPSDEKIFNELDEVEIRALTDKEHQKFVVILTDENKQFAPIKIQKGVKKYFDKNGNAVLKLFFDDETPVSAPQDIEKTITQRERTTMLNIIYGLLKLLTESGKSQNEIISELERFDYRGLKKSTLETYFSNANKIHERG